MHKYIDNHYKLIVARLPSIALHHIIFNLFFLFFFAVYSSYRLPVTKQLFLVEIYIII